MARPAPRPNPAFRLSGVVQLCVMLAVLLLQSQAGAAIFAPVCDPSGATLPVAAPANEGDRGEIDVWACGDDPFSPQGISVKTAPVRGGEGELVSVAAGTPAAPAWQATLCPRPIQKRLIWGEGCSGPLPTGYATSPFRPPRLT